MPVDDDRDGQYPLLGDLVPWPLLLITCCVSMTVLVVETWLGRQAGNDWWQAGTQSLEKSVYAAALCVIIGNTVRLAKEGFMWLRKEKARHGERVAAERDKAWIEWLKSQNITPPQTPPTSENRERS